MSNRTEELYVEFDEKHTVEEASKTRQNAEYELIATTSVDINEPKYREHSQCCSRVLNTKSLRRLTCKCAKGSCD